MRFNEASGDVGKGPERPEFESSRCSRPEVTFQRLSLRVPLSKGLSFSCKNVIGCSKNQDGMDPRAFVSERRRNRGVMRDSSRKNVLQTLEASTVSSERTRVGSMMQFGRRKGSGGADREWKAKERRFCMSKIEMELSP